MPLDLSDAPPIVRDSLKVLASIARSLRKNSAGGRTITPDERKEIGQKLIALGKTFLEEAVD